MKKANSLPVRQVKKPAGLLALFFSSALLVSCGQSVASDNKTASDGPPFVVDERQGPEAVSGDGNVVATMMGLGYPDRNALLLTDLGTKQVRRYFVPDAAAVARAPDLSEDGSTIAFITETTSEPGSTIWIVNEKGKEVTTIKWADQRRVSQVDLDDRGNIFLLRDVRRPEQYLPNIQLDIVRPWGLFHLNLDKQSETRIAPELNWFLSPKFTWLRETNMMFLSPHPLGMVDETKSLLWQEIPDPPLGEGELGYRPSAMGLRLTKNSDGDVIASGSLYRLVQTGAAPEMRGIVVAASADGSAIGIHDTRLDTYRGTFRDPKSAGPPDQSGKQVLLQCKILVDRVDCNRTLPENLVGMSGQMTLSNAARTIVMQDWWTPKPLGIRLIIERYGKVEPIIIEPGKSSKDLILSVKKEVVL